ncbi:MAG: cytidine deaminase [Tannerella sp.]|nr:cytidine deaminase [Tannerella sp.]
MEPDEIKIIVRKMRTDELPPEARRWMALAKEAAGKAYAPYSHFHVGAAVALSDGTVLTGNNQENAAFPSGLCAERVALFSAGAVYPDVTVRALALMAVKDGVVQDEISPCGSCRQVLLETERRQRSPITVMLCGRDVVRIVDSAEQLLPVAFNLECSPG